MMTYSNDFTYGGNPFRSFLMGGFECADHQNAFGERVDMIRLTGHDTFLKEDYDRLSALNIRTVREGIRWSHIEKVPYQYDWTEVDQIILTAAEAGIQVIWDICHFGFPDDLTPLHPMFPRRFAHLCKAFAEHYRSLVPDETLIITPINEVSFLSWLGGDARGTSPYCTTQGWEVKYRLMKAYIEGIEMMKEVDPGIRIMTTEPLIHVVSPDLSDDEQVLNAAAKHEEQFQVLDMLSGKICPELGGKPEFLDILGVNFYFNNQWTSTHHELIPWGELPPHVLWKPLHTLIEEMFLRYGRPVVISETSHPGEHRPQWLDTIAEECVLMLKNGLPLYGCCIYPLIDRPDWDFPALEWHHSGIWDILDSQTLERIPHEDSIRVLKKFSSAVSDLIVSPSYAD